MFFCVFLNIAHHVRIRASNISRVSSRTATYVFPVFDFAINMKYLYILYVTS